jgi:hypothetical protein
MLNMTLGKIIVFWGDFFLVTKKNQLLMQRNFMHEKKKMTSVIKF